MKDSVALEWGRAGTLDRFDAHAGSKSIVSLACLRYRELDLNNANNSQAGRPVNSPSLSANLFETIRIHLCILRSPSQFRLGPAGPDVGGVRVPYNRMSTLNIHVKPNNGLLIWPFSSSKLPITTKINFQSVRSLLVLRKLPSAIQILWKEWSGDLAHFGPSRNKPALFLHSFFLYLASLLRPFFADMQCGTTSE